MSSNHLNNTQYLLVDSLKIENSLRQLSGNLTSIVTPGGFIANAKLVCLSPSTAEMLGISDSVIKSQEFRELFSANKLPSDLTSFATVYSGHQFQVWAGQLGDGRAAYLAQVVNQRGERWDIQLKGAGKTPYSRFGDGRAVLRSSIREFLCSEAMASLNVPTTRALSVFTTGELVQREEYEPGVILTRIAPSHIRFGHFEHFFHHKDYATLTALVEQVIAQHFTHISGQADRYMRWFEEIVTRTAHLMASWQALGFCHGVMNTDNMSILGLTIDYGPFGFLEEFDPYWICNHSDHHGLYAYNEQPAVAHWNLQALALALKPLIPLEESRAIIDRYEQIFTDRFELLFCNKLGLPFDLGYRELWVSLLKLMANDKADFTNTFRQLADSFEKPELWLKNFQSNSEAHTWLDRYHDVIDSSTIPREQILTTIRNTNPKYVLRNWLAERAIRDAQDSEDYSFVNLLHSILEKPFDEQLEYEELAQPAPIAYRNLCVSCSS
jgi:uncharacterized protein YdiU (UPF0061 family)